MASCCLYLSCRPLSLHPASSGRSVNRAINGGPHPLRLQGHRQLRQRRRGAGSGDVRLVRRRVPVGLLHATASRRLGPVPSRRRGPALLLAAARRSARSSSGSDPPSPVHSPPARLRGPRRRSISPVREKIE